MLYTKTNAKIDRIYRRTAILFFGLIIPNYILPSAMQSYYAFFVEKKSAELAFRLPRPATYEKLSSTPYLN